MSQPASAPYVGGELELFARALHWKAYWSSQVRPWIQGSVLEVGAGIGANTELLHTGNHPAWVCLEPDATLLDQLRRRLETANALRCGKITPQVGTIDDLPATNRFDTVLYIDVLEHIRDDADELARAAHRLNPNGHLVVLAPAHNALFSPFDAAIGHFRRYTKRSLTAIARPPLDLVRTFYLDSVGLAASSANRVLLRQSMPTASQIALWDRWMVPLSRRIDPLLFHSIGKTVVAVWRRLP